MDNIHNDKSKRDSTSLIEQQDRLTEVCQHIIENAEADGIHSHKTIEKARERWNQEAGGRGKTSLANCYSILLSFLYHFPPLCPEWITIGEGYDKDKEGNPYRYAIKWTCKEILKDSGGLGLDEKLESLLPYIDDLYPPIVILENILEAQEQRKKLTDKRIGEVHSVLTTMEDVIGWSVIRKQ